MQPLASHKVMVNTQARWDGISSISKAGNGKIPY